MKALSIRQPWASLIAHGIKNIENRTWRTHFRGRIYIHASAKSSGSLYELLNENQLSHMNNIWTSQYFPNRPNSAIIGEVDIVDCVMNHSSIWAQNDCYNWVLHNAILYDKPILNVKGKLSFWELDKRQLEYQCTYDGEFRLVACQKVKGLCFDCEHYKIK